MCLMKTDIFLSTKEVFWACYGFTSLLKIYVKLVPRLTTSLLKTIDVLHNTSPRAVCGDNCPACQKPSYWCAHWPVHLSELCVVFQTPANKENFFQQTTQKRTKKVTSQSIFVHLRIAVFLGQFLGTVSWVLRPERVHLHLICCVYF